jgi:hypothetical protein
MAHTLLSQKLSYTIHIALFLMLLLAGENAIAQSQLQTGDVVVVSVNADTESIDFIPLVDIESGTQLFVSNGVWDDSAKKLSGSEFEVIFLESVSAGTNINLSEDKPSEIVTNGTLSFESETHHVFIYQKQQDTIDFIFGVGWGTGPVWDNDIEGAIGSDIPEALIENRYVLLSLGVQQNHQYYIRNGASGTENLLLKFAGSESNWRGSEIPFSNFGTSFNLVEAPVIIFEQSISNAFESDSMAILNIAIYEHDGSRLTVDVEFDTLRSILSPDDIPNFKPTTINFTGLVGDGVYEVHVPIEDDSMYEGREAGIFTLSGLSDGNFGDFLAHTLFIIDDEIPHIEITEVQNTPGNSGFIEIQNYEEVPVSLNGWKIASGNSVNTFDEKASVAPGERIRWINAAPEDSIEAQQAVIFSSLNRSIFNRRGGELVLENLAGDTVHSYRYDELENARRTARSSMQRLADLGQTIKDREDGLKQVDGYSQQPITEQVQTPGWHSVVYTEGLQELFPDITFYYWSERKQLFEEAIGNSQQSDQLLFGYFDRSSSQKLLTWKLENGISMSQTQLLEFHLSATDVNENEVIDNTEGLNLIVNTLSESFTAAQFLEQFEVQVNEIDISPILYQINRNEDGELIFSTLDPEDEIQPGDTFGVYRSDPEQGQLVRLNGEDILAQRRESDDNEEEDDRSYIELSLSSEEGKKATININMEKDKAGFFVKSLNSYPQFSTQQPSVLNLAFKKGNEFYNSVTITPEIKQSISYPLNFSTIESGLFSFDIESMKNIPEDWEIILEDHFAGKEYNLREGFSLNFEHVTDLPEKFEVNDMSLPLRDYHNGERFELKVITPYVESEEEKVEADKPRRIELHQNYPNPFNPATTISFYLPESQEVKLSVFNIVGQPITVLAEGTLSAGEQHFEWDATDRPSGMYIYQLEVGNNVMTRKMTLVK